MEENQQNSLNNDDEITLKELILKMQEIFIEIRRYWWIVLLCCIPTLSYFIYKSYNTPDLHVAQLTFMLNEDTGNGGGISGLLGSFGLGGGGGGAVNLGKMIELSKARVITDQIIFDKIEDNKELDFVANHIINLYEFHDQWNESKNEQIHNYLFKSSNIDSFDRVDNSAYLSVSKKIVNELVSGSMNETGIVVLESTTRSEALSLQLTNRLFDVLSTYYLDKSIEKQRFTYENAKSKADSVASLLINAEFTLAQFQQKNRNLMLETEKLKEQRLSRTILRLNVVYVEALKIKEQTKFGLDNSTPFIQLIDRPIAPLKRIKESKTKAIILGLFIGGFLAVVFIVGRKILRDAMED